MEEFIERTIEDLKENSGAILPNVHERMDSGDVRLKIQLKMLEFMYSMDQIPKCGNHKKAQQDKMIKVLIM